MPLGSAPTTTIDIDFTRAQGVASTGRIIFQPRRIRVGTTVVSSSPIVVELLNGVGTVDLVRLPEGTYRVREEVDGRAPYEFNFSLPLDSSGVIQYELIAPVSAIPATYTVVRSVNGVLPNPSTGDVGVEGVTGPQGPPGVDGAQGPPGVDGAQGPPGVDGAQGPIGPQGPAGADGEQGPAGEDGIQGPAGADGAIGPQGPAGPPGLSMNPIAVRYGCKAISMDPVNLSVGTASGLKFIAMSSGRLYQMRVPIAPGELISDVRIPIKALGAGAGSLWVGVYQSDLTLLGSSADVATQMSTAPAESWKIVDLTVPAETTGDSIWIAALSTLETGPQLCFSEVDNAGELSWLLNSSGSLNAVYLDAVGSLPSTLDPEAATVYLDCLFGVA